MCSEFSSVTASRRESVLEVDGFARAVRWDLCRTSATTMRRCMLRQSSVVTTLSPRLTRCQVGNPPMVTGQLQQHAGPQAAISVAASPQPHQHLHPQGLQTHSFFVVAQAARRNSKATECTQVGTIGPTPPVQAEFCDTCVTKHCAPTRNQAPDHWDLLSAKLLSKHRYGFTACQSQLDGSSPASGGTCDAPTHRDDLPPAAG